MGVDTVDGNQVCTNSCMIKTIDLMKCETKDLTFESEWSIKASRNDYIHGLVLYWTVEFSACHERTGFTTAPGANYTHWKQTVFYLTDSLTVNKGEELAGMIKCAPNSDNKRDLDFEISYEFYGQHSTLSNVQKYKMR